MANAARCTAVWQQHMARAMTCNHAISNLSQFVSCATSTVAAAVTAAAAAFAVSTTQLQSARGKLSPSQLAQATAAMLCHALSCRCCAAGQLRHFAAGPGPTVVPNPLQQIVPPIIKGIGAAVGGIRGGLAAAADQLTSGPATQSAIAYFADTVRHMQQQHLGVVGRRCLWGAVAIAADWYYRKQQGSGGHALLCVHPAAAERAPQGECF
jgi:hypothetical protein